MPERIDRATFFERLEALDLPAGDWAVHASGAMLARGLLDSIGDIDIVARGAAWAEAARRAPAVRAHWDRKVALDGGIEVFDGWASFDAHALIDAAVTVRGVPCVRLEDVLAFKRWLDRPKDRDHVARLEAQLDVRPDRAR